MAGEDLGERDRVLVEDRPVLAAVADPVGRVVGDGDAAELLELIEEVRGVGRVEERAGVAVEEDVVISPAGAVAVPLVAREGDELAGPVVAPDRVAEPLPLGEELGTLAPRLEPEPRLQITAARMFARVLTVDPRGF